MAAVAGASVAIQYDCDHDRFSWDLRVDQPTVLVVFDFWFDLVDLVLVPFPKASPAVPVCMGSACAARRPSQQAGAVSGRAAAVLAPSRVAVDGLRITVAGVDPITSAVPPTTMALVVAHATLEYGRPSSEAHALGIALFAGKCDDPHALRTLVRFHCIKGRLPFGVLT